MLEEAKWIYSNLEDRNRQGENQLIPFINYQKPAPERCLDMLLSKYRGEHYQTEVVMAKPQKSRLPVLRKKLSQASVMLITDGGLVSYGNPDRVPSVNAGRFYEYPIRGCASLERDKYEVAHQGYDNSFVKEDPNRLVPVDVMRDLEREGIVGKLYDSFLTTVGVMVSTGKSVSLGREIAAYVRTLDVDAVIITSVCGTSTRCGANIGMELEKVGIPVVQITNLTKIAMDIGVRRIVKGNNVCHPLGAPKLSDKGEREYRRKIVLTALEELRIESVDQKL